LRPLQHLSHLVMSKSIGKATRDQPLRARAQRLHPRTARWDDVWRSACPELLLRGAHVERPQGFRGCICLRSTARRTGRSDRSFFDPKVLPSGAERAFGGAEFRLARLATSQGSRKRGSRPQLRSTGCRGQGCALAQTHADRCPRPNRPKNGARACLTDSGRCSIIAAEDDRVGRAQ
jgi:hypothetical protein